MIVRCESFERGRGGMSDHFLVEGKLRWVKTRLGGEAKELNKKETMEE